jgi:hypothetical protein
VIYFEGRTESSGNKVLTKISGPKKEEISRNFRILHEKLSSFVRVVKSRRL